MDKHLYHLTLMFQELLLVSKVLGTSMLRVEGPLLAKAAVKLAQWVAQGDIFWAGAGRMEVQWK